MEHSESVNGHGDEFELDGSLDRPGAAIDHQGPGDAFEVDAKMPKREFESSETLSREEPNRGVDFAIATNPPLSPTSMAPTTLTPTTLTPTTMNPTTQMPSRLATPEPTLAPTEPIRRATTLAPFTNLPTTLAPTTFAPTTVAPTTIPPTRIETPAPTDMPTTAAPVSFSPTTNLPTTFVPTTMMPTTMQPTSPGPTTFRPTVPPSTYVPTPLPTMMTPVPTSQRPTLMPTSDRPTLLPTTQRPTGFPTTLRPTPMPITPRPTTMPVTNRPTEPPITEQPSMHPSILRVAKWKIPTAQTCELDYTVPEGAHADLIPCELIDELIMTLRRGEQLMEPLFGPYNSTYKLEEFLDALNVSYEWDINIAENSVMDRHMGHRERDLMTRDFAPTPSPNAVQMNLAGEKDFPSAKGRVDVAMAHMGLLLGQAYEESMITGVCDEQNVKPTDKVNPGCGQNGLNYRFPNVDGQLGVENHFSCFANEDEWMSGYRPVPGETDPQKQWQFVGCPVQPPVDLITSDVMPSMRPKNEYEAMPMTCGVDANIGSRDCCWWGRGMLQMTYQCDYGDFQKNWGSFYQVPDQVPDVINLCANPAQVCSGEIPEMKYLTGLYTWVKKVVHNPKFNFIQELTAWVDDPNGRDYSPGGFVDRVGGALVYGDPNQTPPNAQERRYYTKAAVEAIMSLPPWGVEQYFHYGNVAQCKPAVQSSIFNSTSDSAAHSALIGHRNASKMADTGCDHDPFWNVDLGRPYQILSVHIVWYENYHDRMMDASEFNVTANDIMSKTNRKLQVDLLDESGSNVASLERTQFSHTVEADGKIESIWTVHIENSTDLMASQVRVSITSEDNDCDFLSMAEVKVMSICQLGDACLTKSSCAEQNVAQCKPTVQSSTIGTDTADLAVDGTNGQVATTECEEAPYFLVDLMDLYNITAVALINYADIEGIDRLKGIVVELLDVNDNVVAEDSRKPNLIGDEMGDVYILKFDDAPAIACKVRVSLQHAPGSCERLKLAEVAVMATCLDDGEHCKTWENCRHQNIGRCMPATQSSTYDGGIAARAVDGHTSLAHTKCEEEPWWGIHLLGSRPDRGSDSQPRRLLLREIEQCPSCFAG